ncbi:MAG: hypothetical protein RL596_886 [Bacteroidota bacterium]|jgi:putative addiction module component (TIGR02574 family)
MGTLSIRRELHNYLELADDKKVKAMYVMMEQDIREKAVDYTEEFKAELDRRYANYKSGKAKLVSSSESKKRISRILKSKGH